MTDADPPIQCANPECRVADTGKCVEGLEFTACPNYGRERTDSASSSDTDSESAAGIRLRSAEQLDLDAASEVLRATASRVIAIVGPLEAGKTSLLASLYDLFQTGKVGDVCFAGSRTLHAFERACHDSRSASRRAVPIMERTKRGRVQFYHLDVVAPFLGSKIALLLGDRAREEYRQAADDITNTDRFSEVKRADTITLLIDGKRMTEPADRHNVIAGAADMLQALIEGGASRTGQRLAIVLTKVDVVRASGHQERVQNDFVRLIATLTSRFAATFPVIRPFEVAACPADTTLPRGTGVAALLDYWLQPRAAMAVTPVPQDGDARMFARLRTHEPMVAGS